MTTTTSGKTHSDHRPWLSESSGYRYPFQPEDGFSRYTYAPRPEFDNHNPILAELRRTVDLGASLPAMVQVFRNWFRFGKAEKIPSTPEQQDHAWRVLEKLAALYNGAAAA